MEVKNCHNLWEKTKHDTCAYIHTQFESFYASNKFAICSLDFVQHLISPITSLFSSTIPQSYTHPFVSKGFFFFFLISRLLNSRNLIFSPHIACLELLSVFTYSCSKEDSVLMRWQMGLIMIFFRVQIHMFFSCLEVLGVEGFLKSFCKLCGLKNYHKL